MGYNFVVYKKVPIMTLNEPKTSNKKLDFVGLFQEQDLVLGVMGVGLIGVLWPVWKFKKEGGIE